MHLRVRRQYQALNRHRQTAQIAAQALELTVLRATERSRPRSGDRIDSKLITDLQVTSRAESLKSCLTRFAYLGCDLDRSGDAPAGCAVFQRGSPGSQLSRLAPQLVLKMRIFESAFRRFLTTRRRRLCAAYFFSDPVRSARAHQPVRQ